MWINIDKSTNRIVGYGSGGYSREYTEVPDSQLQDILLDELAGGMYSYIDGEIIKNEEPCEYAAQKARAEQEIEQARQLVEDEQHVFMDVLIDGKGMDEAKKLVQANRDSLAQREAVLEQLLEAEKTRVRANLQHDMERIGSDYKYNLSVMTVVRDENEYLPEWIRYYTEEIGVDHFYIYDNESKTPVSDALKEHTYYDRCTIVRCPTTQFTQQTAYNDYLEGYSSESKWVLGCDPDEYLVFKKSKKCPTVKSLLDRNDGYRPIKCPWVFYNANGQEKRTDGTDMERFTQTVEFPEEAGGGKYIVRTDAVSWFSAYVPVIKYLGRYMDYQFDDDVIVLDGIQLNHYYTRSYEEWCGKMRRGSCHPYALRKFSDFFKLNPDMAYLDTGVDWAMAYGPAASENAAENDAELEDAVEADESGDMENAEPDEKTSG